MHLSIKGTKLLVTPYELEIASTNIMFFNGMN